MDAAFGEVSTKVAFNTKASWKSFAAIKDLPVFEQPINGILTEFVPSRLIGGFLRHAATIRGSMSRKPNLVVLDIDQTIGAAISLEGGYPNSADPEHVRFYRERCRRKVDEVCPNRQLIEVV